MKIDNINIKNFRCFDETEISFGTKATVFIGKNGTGKSSIISSLKRGLSFLFAQNRDFSHILSTSSHSNVRQFEFWDARFSEIERVFNYPISIKFNGHFSNKPISWELKKETPKGRVQSTLYKEAQNAILAYYHTNIKNAKLPLLAFYSDSYPHILSNVGSFAKKLVSQDVIPRDFGYYGWDETTNCMELWLIRFNKVSKFIRDYDTDLERTKKQTKQFNENSEGTIAILNKRLEQLKNDKRIIQFRNELSFIENKILKLTEPLDDNLDFINNEFQIVRLLSNNPIEGADDSLEFIFANGSSIFFDMLPQGYKRIFSIAIDLAYRSYILNEATDSEGVVFIDEVELHLHPTLQQEIFQRLIRTFPNFQFIVTTHSPLIISNMKADGNDFKTIKLKKDGLVYSNESIDNIFGIDYNTGLIGIMEAKYRASHIDNLINSYITLKLRNRNEDAQKIWDEIFSIVGTDNEGIKNEINEKIEANRQL